jgi:glycosyltransferase involved in cell wall biosynthesis
MKFLLYTKIGEDSVQQSLGLPEYSYYFVYKEFKGIFSKLGDVVSVYSETDIHEQYRLAIEQGDTCVVVFFCPPHVAPDVFPYPSFCVLAWEFDTIPDEVWDEDPRNDWRYVFNRQLGLICLSSHTRYVVERAMGDDFLVSDIPVPVWDRFKDFPVRIKDSTADHTLQIESIGSVIDSRSYRVEEGVFEYIAESPSLQLSTWGDETLELDFSNRRFDSAYLGGFYLPEEWGSWSRLEYPWVMLPMQLHGDFDVELQARGFGPTVGQSVGISFGRAVDHFNLQADLTTYYFSFRNVAPCNLVRFTGLDMTPHAYHEDPRSMILGLEKIRIIAVGKNQIDIPPTVRNMDLGIEGIVYTTVFNPVDARKNWELIVSAFCYAFKNDAKATLILKVTHQTVTSIMGRLHYLLQRIGPITCRVVAIHGFLPDDNFNRLIDGTHYYVNASTCEGLCLPMMEFMACGVPAIAPDHTAMQDYSNGECSFIVNSSLEPAIWPHDPRQYKRARSYRIEWSSLVEQFQKSYACFYQEPSQYRRRAKLSREKVRDFSNGERVQGRVVSFLDNLTVPPNARMK